MLEAWKWAARKTLRTLVLRGRGAHHCRELPFGHPEVVALLLGLQARREIFMPAIEEYLVAKKCDVRPSWRQVYRRIQTEETKYGREQMRAMWAAAKLGDTDGPGNPYVEESDDDSSELSDGYDSDDEYSDDE